MRERRDVDLILGQGMLASGWAADTLNAPGKFLISTPEHTTPRRARAYRVDDNAVAAIASRHAEHRPQLDALSQRAIEKADEADDGALDEVPLTRTIPPTCSGRACRAPQGCSVKELMTATGMGRSWVYARLQDPRRRRTRHPNHSRPLDRHRRGRKRPGERLVRADVRDTNAALRAGAREQWTSAWTFWRGQSRVRIS